MAHWYFSLIATLVVAADGNGTAATSASDWWSLRPIERPDIGSSTSPWVRSPIDAFVLAKLREKGVVSSPEADRQTLIRRLTYNLHGLPPTPDEIDSFLHDPRPDAYERLVDRLLNSPRYGERWGRHWLDVVHYGDSHGYDKDKPRPNSWPYRDYVIRSLNDDKSYGRFVREQVAGDILYPDDPDGIVATGFIAAGPWDFVGHVELPETKRDGLIARYNDRDDMVSTTMSTFVSLTVHCARCHNHKFDPITQQDYYRLQAVFAGVDRAERPYDREPTTHIRRRALVAQRTQLEKRLRSLEEPIARITSPEIAQLDERSGELKSRIAKLAQAGAASPSNGYHSAIMPTPDNVKWVQADLGSVTPVDEIRLVPARPTDFPDTPGFGFPLRYRIELSDDPQFATATIVADRSADDQPNPGDKPVVLTLGARPARYVRVTATRLWKRTNDFVFALAEMEVMSAGKDAALGAAISAYDSIEAGRWSTKFLVDGFSSRQALASAENSPIALERRSLEAELERLTRERQRHVELQLDEPTKRSLAETRAALEQTQRGISELPAPSLVYGAAADFPRQGSFGPAGTPRTVHLLNRGDVQQPGEVMAPGSVACVKLLSSEFQLPDPNDEGARRAALAHWITDPSNPLTWRSIVNRVWQYHVGRGIVDTPNDFGRMGEEPTHPELLDWLATWFLENGQSLKALHRLILTSSVYRQQSQDQPRLPTADFRLPSDSQLPSDSDNRYLWRMNRTRLDAESIRDAVLFAADKLDSSMGGPSVQQFHFKDDHSPVYDYTQFDWDGPNAGRRSIYRFVVRSVPDPFMDSFDCADANQLTPKRNTTLTALQSLSLLNNPFMVRQAQNLAGRARAKTSLVADQIRAACRWTWGRSPSTDELRDWSAYVREHGLENFCRLLLNSNEFMFVD
jgi:hypothetical protein